MSGQPAAGDARQPVIPPPLSPARNASPVGGAAGKHRSPQFNTDNIEVSLLPGAGLALERLGSRKLVVLGLPLLGLSVCWHCLFLLATPYFHELGLSHQQSKAVWFALPVSGVVLTPTVGLLSDHCTSSMGRRKPFMLVGLVLVSAFLVLFSCGGPLENKYGGTAARAMCLVGFVVAVGGLQIIQVPVRTLISDLALPEQQLSAHSFATVLMGVGRVVGSMLTYVTVEAGAHSVYKVFGVCVALLVLSCVPLFATVKEVSLSGLSLASPLQALRKTVEQLRSLPPTMKHLCAVHALCWAAFFCFLPFGSWYFGKRLYEDDSHWTDKGVSIFSLGLAFASASEMVFAFGIPFFAERVAAMGLYALGFLVLAFAFVLFTFARHSGTVLLLVAATGISFAVSSTFPFSLAGRLAGQGRQMGLLIGALDMCMYLGMFVDVLFFPFVDGQLVFAVGALWCLLAILASKFVHFSFGGGGPRREIMV